MKANLTYLLTLFFSTPKLVINNKLFVSHLIQSHIDDDANVVFELFSIDVVVVHLVKRVVLSSIAHYDRGFR